MNDFLVKYFTNYTFEFDPFDVSVVLVSNTWFLFLTMSLELRDDLRDNLLSRPFKIWEYFIFYQSSGFFDLLQYRFQKKSDSTSVSDIYDGRLYKELSTNATDPLSHPTNISFTWNTDSIPVFKSSSFSLWPLYLVVNELPPKKRFAKENCILAGLWFGP
ncbi:uncharacterized protein LOC125557474 [Nematostella vectensis]|uniref:uncharacterized protein LOC125557474 n=1 Tax=Nematostella vectensis TaxID=45351 RepID=UPI0020775E60|nr:uncharacterized protein LOC125557474 [Nematostella vectensis]